MLRRFLQWLFPARVTSQKTEEEPEPQEEEQPIELPIEDSIDLHTFSPKEVASVVEEYLQAAHQKGFREVRIIHGKGKGVQRRIVHSILGRHPLVQSFSEAPSHRGGWGATVAQLIQQDETAKA